MRQPPTKITSAVEILEMRESIMRFVNSLTAALKGEGSLQNGAVENGQGIHFRNPEVI